VPGSKRLWGFIAFAGAVAYSRFMSNVVSIEKVRDDLRAGRYRKVFSSLRAMRRLLERTTIEAYEGQRPMRDVVAMAQSVKAMAEIFVAEKTLMAAGLDVEEQNHALGDNGGMPELTPRSHVTRTRSFKKGTGARGTPVDEYRVVEEGAASDGRDLAEVADDMEGEF